MNDFFVRFRLCYCFFLGLLLVYSWLVLGLLLVFFGPFRHPQPCLFSTLFSSEILKNLPVFTDVSMPFIALKNSKNGVLHQCKTRISPLNTRFHPQKAGFTPQEGLFCNIYFAESFYDPIFAIEIERTLVVDGAHSSAMEGWREERFRE